MKLTKKELKNLIKEEIQKEIIEQMGTQDDAYLSMERNSAMNNILKNFKILLNTGINREEIFGRINKILDKEPIKGPGGYF